MHIAAPKRYLARSTCPVQTHFHPLLIALCACGEGWSPLDFSRTAVCLATAIPHVMATVTLSYRRDVSWLVFLVLEEVATTSHTYDLVVNISLKLRIFLVAKKRDIPHLAGIGLSFEVIGCGIKARFVHEG